MGRGWDETGEKGVCIVTLEEEAQAVFVPLGLPRFLELEGSAGELEQLLPAAGSRDFFRLTLTGWEDGQTLTGLTDRFPHMTVRDRRRPDSDLWEGVGEDTLMGLYFRRLQEQSVSDPRALLAARLSRSILEDREVPL